MNLTRHLAALGAIGSLALLGWTAWRAPMVRPSAVTSLALYTAGAQPAAAGADVATRSYALPDATTAPADVPRVPDVAFLRRAYPHLQHVTLLGDGLNTTEAEALRGVSVAWQTPAPVRAGLVALSWPRTMALGERITVQGRLHGLSPGTSSSLRLVGPDQSIHTADVRADERGEAVFTIEGGAVAAPGAFEWMLHGGDLNEPVTIGALVAEPEALRVLLLQASPSVEASRLQRWLAQTGSRVTSRTRISGEHMRFAAANDSLKDFTRVDAELLTHFDVCVATEAALQELGADEHAALQLAMEKRGLGMLVIGEPADGAATPNVSRWPLVSDETVNQETVTRTARLRLSNGGELKEPITTLAADMGPTPLARAIARDPQDRVVAAARPRGRGWEARSLVVDTWRWQQNGHDDAFAAFWSAMLGAVARSDRGQWHIGSPAYPLFQHAPVDVVWVAPDENASPPAATVAPRGGETLELALVFNRDVSDPTVYRARYWPPQPGWHELRSPTGDALAFHLQPAHHLRALRAENRRAATARLATGVMPPALTESAATPSGSASWWKYVAFGVFVVSAGVLFRRPPQEPRASAT